MMAQDLAESAWKPINYGRFINQFPSDTIKLTRKDEYKNVKTKDVYIF